MDVLAALRQLTTLAAFARRTPGLPDAPAGRPGYPWAELAEIAMRNGVAPIVAYNMEYRLGGGGAPEEIHDQLLGWYQGTLNDNVFKLVNLKQLIGGEPFPILLLEAAAYADAVYPHVAFRAVPEVRMIARRADFFRLAEKAEPLGFKVGGQEGHALVLTDQRTRFLVYPSLFGAEPHPEEQAMYERGIAARVYGPGVRRPTIEDAIVTHVALMAAGGFEAPLIEFVDLRELVQGCPAQGSTWERPPEPELVRARAEALGLSRALYCAMRLLSDFFPAVAAPASALTPELNFAVRALLDKAIVEPAKNLGRERVNRAAEEIRKLLAGA